MREPDETTARLLMALYGHRERVDWHYETLAQLPAVRMEPLKQFLMAQDGLDSLAEEETALKSLELCAHLTKGAGYTRQGWEKAARAHIARHGNTPPG